MKLLAPTLTWLVTTVSVVLMYGLSQSSVDPKASPILESFFGFSVLLSMGLMGLVALQSRQATQYKGYYRFTLVSMLVAGLMTGYGWYEEWHAFFNVLVGLNPVVSGLWLFMAYVCMEWSFRPLKSSTSEGKGQKKDNGLRVME